MFHKILAARLLLSGIVLAIVITPTYLFLVGGPTAVIALSTGYLQRYALHVWLGFDKFINACRGGDHRETVSSCLGKSIDYNADTVFFIKPIDRLVYHCLNLVDPDHCTKSIDWTVGRKFEQ